MAEEHAGAWLSVAALAVLFTIAGFLWHDLPAQARPGRACPPGDWDRALAEASAAAVRGEPTLALRCAYRAYIEAEAAGAGAALVQVGDFLHSLGRQRYLKISVRSAYLRAAEHARQKREWPVMAAVATRLLALGDLEEAGALLAELCSQMASGAPGVPCDPIRLTAVPTLSGEE
ncbi:MAG: hypothetical protein HY575_05660 [candidate division NC10 bacterium]|nr:hypothetical protein [candidate division NC10 bacterium]